MATFSNTQEFREAEFTNVNMAGIKITDADLSGVLIREANLSGMKMVGVYMESGEIDGAVRSLRINGVDVMPLVEAELDRQYPERLLLRSTTPESLREAWAILEKQWAETMRRAASLQPEALDRSVNGEWSFKQTLRHLVYATDSWLGNAILGEQDPFHPLGLVFTGGPAGGTAGPEVDFPYEEIVAAREGRQAKVRSFLESAAQQDLDRRYGPHETAPWPEPRERTALECLHVILNEEWWHNRFANRDLDLIETDFKSLGVPGSPVPQGS